VEHSEREDLDELVNSDGWRRFKAFADAEWGDGGHRFVQGVTDAAKDDTSRGTDILRQILVAQREIRTLLIWPEARLKAISKPELVEVGSRRGSL